MPSRGKTTVKQTPLMSRIVLRKKKQKKTKKQHGRKTHNKKKRRKTNHRRKTRKGGMFKLCKDCVKGLRGRMQDEINYRDALKASMADVRDFNFTIPRLNPPIMPGDSLFYTDPNNRNAGNYRIKIPQDAFANIDGGAKGYAEGRGENIRLTIKTNMLPQQSGTAEESVAEQDLPTSGEPKQSPSNELRSIWGYAPKEKKN